MPAPKLVHNASLDTVRRDLVFSRARCKADPKAADQVAVFNALLGKRWSAVNDAQLAAWDAQDESDALVAAADAALDALVARFSAALVGVLGKGYAAHPRYVLYFAIPPSALVRPILGAQLETLRGWLKHLARETDAALAPFAALFAAAVKTAGDAVKARRDADAENAGFRKTGALAAYLSDVAKRRDGVYATLDARRIEDPSAPRHWASGFFRHRPPAASTDADRTARDAEREAEKAAAAAKKQAVADAKAKVKEAQKALRALELKKASKADKK